MGEGYDLDPTSAVFPIRKFFGNLLSTQLVIMNDMFLPVHFGHC